MDNKTVDSIYTLSEQITLQTYELVTAIYRLPPALQNAYAVTAAAILLSLKTERLPGIPVKPLLRREPVKSSHCGC